jgi:hypothetical protein
VKAWSHARHDQIRVAFAPNGQIPAYEWNFADVNPPVHTWSTIFTYRPDQAQKGEGDREWLKSSFHKLLLNFTRWVNHKDRSGRNVFEGGFLGLGNIGVFDRSAPRQPHRCSVAHWWMLATAPVSEMFPVESENHGTSLLSFAIPNQYACLVDGAIPRPAAASHVG